MQIEGIKASGWDNLKANSNPKNYPKTLLSLKCFKQMTRAMLYWPQRTAQNKWYLNLRSLTQTILKHREKNSWKTLIDSWTHLCNCLLLMIQNSNKINFLRRMKSRNTSKMPKLNNKNTSLRLRKEKLSLIVNLKSLSTNRRNQTMMMRGSRLSIRRKRRLINSGSAKDLTWTKLGKKVASQIVSSTSL